ncbi:ADP-ribosyl-[dinitrogen reductase] hydrolase [Candidatus Magnetaquicoccus inordinatus]|uniref:ADP-ribosyl-[dinitrogen reductase] hydrolase n=1 Tax=Candidatus Magnetaquicoccus inordinatus TaxID=2496818 RepID=UPI00187D5295|nr:ADP-ribosyl-[dinitrogen reductase] hydrolase [Candidatus Magnetaquicoccus inordinatus]
MFRTGTLSRRARQWSLLQQRAVAAYLGLAIGDALGATVEFMTPREIEATMGRHEQLTGGGWLRLKPGQVTDDTTMSLALGESILQTGGVDGLAAAQAFDQWMRSKPVDIGATVRRGIVHFRNTGETEVPYSEQSASNGSCMRLLPVVLGYYQRPETEMAQALLVQGRLTHHNALAEAGSLCIARMLRMALQGADLPQMLQGPIAQLLAEYEEFAFRRRRPLGNPSGYIVESLRVVFELFVDTDSLQSCLVETVNRGGDADTTGAIAGMLAGARYGLEAIPRSWYDRLDPEIAERCIAQALALLEL